MNDQEHINNYLVDAISRIVNVSIKQSNLDATIQGHIKTSEGDSLYTVAIHGKEFHHVPCSSDMTFEANESVWITVPQQVWEEKFISGRRR